jgi:hypothetical protein
MMTLCIPGIQLRKNMAQNMQQIMQRLHAVQAQRLAQLNEMADRLQAAQAQRDAEQTFKGVSCSITFHTSGSATWANESKTVFVPRSNISYVDKKGKTIGIHCQNMGTTGSLLVDFITQDEADRVLLYVQQKY